MLHIALVHVIWSSIKCVGHS